MAELRERLAAELEESKRADVNSRRLFREEKAKKAAELFQKMFGMEPDLIDSETGQVLSDGLLFSCVESDYREILALVRPCEQCEELMFEEIISSRHCARLLDSSPHHDYCPRRNLSNTTEGDPLQRLRDVLQEILAV